MNYTNESGPQRSSEPPPVRARNQPEPVAVERQGWQPVDLATLLERTKTNWRFGLWIFGAGCVITAAVVLLHRPLYRSETTIAYREGIQNHYVGQEGPDPLRTLASRLRETLLARPSLTPIVDQFQLYPSKMERGGHVAAVDELRTHIQFRTRSPDTFVISFESNNQELVAPVTQQLASVLVDDMERSGKSQAKITAEFLTSERLRFEEELRGREKELAVFLSDHPEFAQEARPCASVLAAEREAGPDPGLAALERQVPRLRTSLAQRGPGGRAADPRLEAAKAQAEQELRTAQQHLTEQSSRFTALHPDVQSAARRVSAAQAQLAQAEAAIAAAGPGNEQAQAATETQLRQIQGEIAARKIQIRSEKAKKAASSKTVDRVVTAETDHARLTREVADARARVEAIDVNLATARMAESSKASGYGARIDVIDPAFRPPTPISMQRGYMVLMGIGASLLLGFGLAAARGVLLDQRIYRATDVVRLPVPVLTVVPRVAPTPAPSSRRMPVSSRPASSLPVHPTPVRSPPRLTHTLQGVGSLQDPDDDNGGYRRVMPKLLLPSKE
jgi:uncharacterized protein involved in exopolysaccharide biosynthesis